MQQPLPFTVLKLHIITIAFLFDCIELQQPLPFTVLKPILSSVPNIAILLVATALTVYGIETMICVEEEWQPVGCNSPYRLRY